MCSLFSFLRFLIKVGEEVEEVFGSIFVSAFGKDTDSVLEFLPSDIVVGFAGSATGGVVAVEHRPDFEQGVPHIEKIRVENLFRRLHGVSSQSLNFNTCKKKCNIFQNFPQIPILGIASPSKYGKFPLVEKLPLKVKFFENPWEICPTMRKWHSP